MRHGIGVGVNILRRPGIALPALPSSPLLFDTYTVARGYMLHKTKSTQSKLIRVRRSSDNTEQDIGFESSGWVDRAALLSFAGSGDAFITKWYDPTNGVSDATCTVAGNQAYIVIAGVLQTLNDRPIAVANGRSCYYNATAVNTNTTNHMGLGFIGQGVHSASAQVPVGHRSDRNLLTWARCVPVLANTDKYSMYLTMDSGDAVVTRLVDNATIPLQAHAITASSQWANTGGTMYYDGTALGSYSSANYFPNVGQGGRNTNPSYCPMMGDSQGYYWYGTFGGAFWTTSAIDYAAIGAAIKNAWGL